MMLLAAALALHLDLGEATGLRLASTGTGLESVEWTTGTHTVAWTSDSQAAFVELPEGEHTLWATTAASHAWRVLARADAPGDGEASFVPAWTAAQEPTGGRGRPVLPAALVLLAVVVAAGARRGTGFGRHRALEANAQPPH